MSIDFSKLEMGLKIDELQWKLKECEESLELSEEPGDLWVES